ncbi:MAG: hypothetical protein JNL10_04135 [Verrucomicrobiales bacterium]|nr:hypothetical protein [Verrucomicrobiales bacterium]
MHSGSEFETFGGNAPRVGVLSRCSFIRDFVEPWIRAAALTAAGALAGAQHAPSISHIRTDAAGHIRTLVHTAPDHYAVLYRGSNVDSIRTPCAFGVPSEADPLELIDNQWPLANGARFYQVRQFSSSEPGDADQDGLNDLYEASRTPHLNPLQAADAAWDPDGDFRRTLDEIESGTDPFVADPVAVGATAYPMPAGTPFDPNPTDPEHSLVQHLLVYAVDGDGNSIPLKTLTLQNNSPVTVYPILRDGNNSATTNNPPVGLYDPYDPINVEYRGYVGYRDTNGLFLFGLPPGQSVTLRVPLVFWDGARMGLVTDGRHLTPAPGEPNPLHYDPNAQRVIVAAEPVPASLETPGGASTNGVVMWYRTALLAPALDSPDQLVEWTIRDQAYLSNPQITNRTGGQIPASQQVTLINYDVSYVDNMFLPVAMEALEVPVPAPPAPFTQNPGPYGWIGSTNTSGELQAKIHLFTTPKNSLLGTYFSTNGWPTYNMPPDPLGQIKIPAGQNVFAQSPLAGALSSYDVLNNHFMLSSGGTAPIRVNIGGQGTASTGNVLTLSPLGPVSNVLALQPGDTVIGYAPPGQSNPIQPGTILTDILHVSTGPGDPSTVQLSQPLVASQEGCNFDFVRPVTDYASDAMIRLWYSWVELYRTSMASVPSQTIAGAVSKDGATLSFATSVHGLVPGMQVTGPGLDAPNPALDQGGVILLAIAPDQQSVTLSQLARSDHPLTEGAQYTFLPPQILPNTPSNLYTFHFASDPVEPSRSPGDFSLKAYLVVGAMSQIATTQDIQTPPLLQRMNNVVGGNMGFIFDTDARRFSPDGLAVSARIRDMIKSLLRGVSDFGAYPEFDTNGHRIWYPNPSDPRGGLSFNAYNLDPFVWFVHVVLGFSGYGFSLDDDTADVGAGEATQFLLTVSGPGGLPNTNSWSIQAVYGPVTGTGNWDPSQSVSFYQAVTAVTDASPIVITSAGHGLSEGEQVIIDQVEGNTAANGTWTVANPTVDTFQLLNSSGNGAYSSGGRWTRGPQPFISGVDPLNVYWKLKGDDRQAGFTGAWVSGPGVPKLGTVRIVQLGDNQLGVLALNTNLVSADGTPLAKGSYTWTFTGH